jgi:tetratricopeptide (TPR) repeat protein
MMALYRGGRPAEALEVARRLRTLLIDQAGLDPGPALRELEQAILRNDPSLLPAVPSTVRTAAAPGTSARPVPAQLPAGPRDFVGRAEYLRALDALIPADGLTHPTTAVVSAILGVAGIGKTALAVHWGQSVSRHFPDGQLYLDMRGYSTDPPVTPLEALGRFLRALGVPVEQIPSDVDEAAAAYRTMLASRRMLVLIDNAHAVDQVRPLLPSAAGCLCLVTSRSALSGLIAINGATPVTLDALSLGEAVALLSASLGEERVAADPGAIAELAGACGYLPLALRIAAAQLVLNPRLRPADLLARLAGDRLGVLSLPEDRQASVRAAFDCSYAALVGESQRTLRLLGLAPGPEVTVPAVAALCDRTDAEVAASLGRLAAAHLIEPGTAGRFGMHDLVREYARAIASTVDSEGDRDAAIDRLIAWRVRTTESAAGMVSAWPVRLSVPSRFGGDQTRFADRGSALQWLNDERVNLVDTIRFAAGHGRPEVVWLLADLLRGYFRRGMYVSEWIEGAESAIHAAEQAPDDMRWRVEAISRLSLGLAHQALGKPAAALREFEAARDSARRAGWLDLEASAIGNLGVQAWRAGDLSTAARHLTTAVEIARQTGSAGIEANNLGNLAIVNEAQGRLIEAAAAFADLVPLFHAQGQPEGEAHATSNLADVYRQLGRYDDALRQATRAAALFRDIGDASEAAALSQAAQALCALGEPRRARSLVEEALAIAVRSEHRYLEVDCLEVLAHAYGLLGEHRSALEYAEQAMRVAVEVDSPEKLIQAGSRLATACRAVGRLDEARTHAVQALERARGGQLVVYEVEAMITLAEIELARGATERAVELAGRVRDIGRATGYEPVRRRADDLLAAAMGSRASVLAT